jgi:hypothetical protein
MRAALPHMEAYLCKTKLDARRHDWCVFNPWHKLRMWLWVPRPVKTFPNELNLHQQLRLFAELYKELMTVAERVLQSKAVARTQDHALCLLFQLTEPPKFPNESTNRPRLDAGLNLWPGWDLSTVCEHRLRLLDQFSFSTEAQNTAAFAAMVVADEWGKWSDPIHEEFLAKVEKLPNRWLPGIVRANREFHLRGPNSKPAAPPAAKVVPDAEVLFHPIALSIVGEPKPFRGHVFSWLETADGIDAVLGDTASGSPAVTSLFLMKEKGRLIRLPLLCCEAPMHSGINHNLCWDGRFLWVASPDQEPHPSTPGQERFLAVVDPRSEEITKFTAEDGLPPMVTL